MNHATTILPFALLVAMTTVGSTATAQPPPAAASGAEAVAIGKRADELVRRATALGKKDRWVDAEPLLREAWGLKKSYDIAGNLGLAEAALGKPRDAAEHLAFALRTFPVNGKAEHRNLMEQAFTKAKLEVGELKVRVNVDSADILIDGKSVGLAPLADPVFVAPGPHTLSAKLAGYSDATEAVDAAKGSSREASLTLIFADPTAPIATAPAPVAPPPRKSIIPIVVGAAVATAGIAIGITGLVVSGSNSSDATTLRTQLEGANGTSACKLPANATACAELDSAYEGAGTFRGVGIVGFAVAGAAVVGTVVYLLLPGKSASEAPVKAAVSVGPSGGGVAFSGSF